MKNNFLVYTLGCKLNYSESSDIARNLKENGLKQKEPPDFVIINSCAVTSSAVKKSRNLTAQIHRKYPNAEIIVIGCYVSLEHNEIKNWQGVSAVFNSTDKTNVINYLLSKPLSHSNSFISAFSSEDRTRSFLKIQDGCDYNCSYCTVAKARGSSRSDTIEGVMKQIETISKLGIKEVNLTGVNIGDFGNNNGENFLSLLKKIDTSSFIDRIRISSIEPNLLTDEMLEFIAQSKHIMPHFHIPLQAGSDEILKTMRRRYDTDFFKKKVNFIKSIIPDACVAVDVITGFPGETDTLFRESVNFINKLPISYLHVFTYSKRPGTLAAEMKQVCEIEKKQRTLTLLKLSDEKLYFFHKQHYGNIRPVLFETNNHNGFIVGFTDNYIKIKEKFDEKMINNIILIKLSEENIISS